MAHLVLHIGAHKTGTSYIQHLFHHNIELFKQYNVYYPHIGPNAAHHVLALPWIDIPEMNSSDLIGGSAEALWDYVLAEYADAKGTVFLSSEVFSRIKLQCVDMKDLADRVSAFESVKVVYTVRQQCEFLQSIWLQVIKTGFNHRLGPFIDHAVTEHLATGIWIEHGKVLDHIESGFSPDQIHVFDYDKLRKSPRGLAGAFFDLLGLPQLEDQLIEVSGTQANISPDPVSMFIASQISPTAIPSASLLRNIRTSMFSDGNRRSTIFSRADVARIEQVFEPYNAALVARVQKIQPEFEMSVSNWDDNLIYRDDVPVASYVNLARKLLTVSDLI